MDVASTQLKINQENIHAEVDCCRSLLQRGSLHEDCLSSISENDLDDIQIFVEDNNSTDGTVQKVETFLDSLPKKKLQHFNLHKRTKTVSVCKNFREPFDLTDTPYFMWIGSHDMITNNFFKSCFESFEANPTASMVSGKPLALSSDSSDLKDLGVVYDFKSDDPLTRYLKSARELGDCTIFHSIFKRDAVQNFNWPCMGSADHIFISNILWHGTLIYCNQAGYMRRYFDSANRQARADAGHYLDEKNRVLFFSEYMKNFADCTDGQYPTEILGYVHNLLFSILCQRFGLPNTQKQHLIHFLRWLNLFR